MSRQKKYQDKHATDAALVLREAKYQIKFNADGKITHHKNNHGRLNVIAVFGPGHQELRLEVGLGRTRPYHECNIPDRQPHEPVNFVNRIRGEELNPAEYGLVRDALWELLIGITVERRGRWKNGGTWYYQSTKNWVSRKNRRIHQHQVRYGIENGVHFSINTQDTQVLDDLMSLEFHPHNWRYHELNGFARFCIVAFSRFEEDSRKTIKKTKHSVQILEQITGRLESRYWNRRHALAAFSLIAMNKRPGLAERLAREYGFGHYELMLMRRSLKVAESLPGPPAFFREIPRSSPKDYVTYEIRPSYKAEADYYDLIANDQA